MCPGKPGPCESVIQVAHDDGVLKQLPLLIAGYRWATKVHLRIGTPSRIKWAGDEIAQIDDDIWISRAQMSQDSLERY